MTDLAIQAARSQRASSADRLSVMPAQFLQAIVINLARQVRGRPDHLAFHRAREADAERSMAEMRD